MTADIVYHIRKVGDDWALIRGANCSILQDGTVRAATPLPDTMIATFVSEEEANLFGFWLGELRTARRESAEREERG